MFNFRFSESVYCCQLHPNLELAVSGSGDDTACMWEVKTGNVVLEMKGLN